MDALDKLLVMCHAQALNLFVESYLKMVQKLLECNETDLQCLATSSVSTHDGIPNVIIRFCLRHLHGRNDFSVICSATAYSSIKLEFIEFFWQ